MVILLHFILKCHQIKLFNFFTKKMYFIQDFSNLFYIIKDYKYKKINYFFQILKIWELMNLEIFLQILLNHLIQMMLINQIIINYMKDNLFLQVFFIKLNLMKMMRKNNIFSFSQKVKLIKILLFKLLKTVYLNIKKLFKDKLNFHKYKKILILKNMLYTRDKRHSLEFFKPNHKNKFLLLTEKLMINII